MRTVFLMKREILQIMIMFAYPGTLNLAEIQEQIRFQEAGSLQLDDCIVSTDKNNQPINIIKFNELSAGQVPDDIVLVEAKTSQPANTSKKVLTDVLVIENQFKTIDFYR